MASETLIQLGTLTLNRRDDNGVLWRVDKNGLAGWGSTGSTIEPVQRTRRGGAWAGDAFHRERYPSVSGSITAPTPELLEAAEDSLNATVTLADTRLTVTKAGRARYLIVRRNSEALITRVNERMSVYTVSLVAPDYRKFGIDLVGSTFLPSTLGGLTIPTVHRRNLLPNSSGRVNTTGYSFSQGTITTNPGLNTYFRCNGAYTAGNAHGIFRVFTVGVDLEPNTTYILSATIRGYFVAPGTEADSPSVRLRANGAGAAVTGSSDVVEPGSYVRVSCTFTTGASGVVNVGVQNMTTTTANSRMLFLDALVEEGTVLGSYVDGSKTDTGTAHYAWSGAANNSPSDEWVASLTVPFSIDAEVVSGTVSLANPGNETGKVTLRIDGPCTGPRITHTGSGRGLVFSSSLILGAGDWLQVDMEKKTALANGQASRNGFITSREWSGFDPGPNTWAFAATEQDPASKLTITATPAWK